MKSFECDICGLRANPEDGADYVENWESVTISTEFHYDVCSLCAPKLFGMFLKRNAAVPHA